MLWMPDKNIRAWHRARVPGRKDTNFSVKSYLLQNRLFDPVLKMIGNASKFAVIRLKIIYASARVKRREIRNEKANGETFPIIL